MWFYGINGEIYIFFSPSATFSMPIEMFNHRHSNSSTMNVIVIHCVWQRNYLVFSHLVNDFHRWQCTIFLSVVFK